MSAVAYVIYFILFIVLLLEPHIIKGHVAGMNAPFLQSLSTIVIVGVAGLVYWLHQRDIERREYEKTRLKQENAKSLDHLIDLSADLGLVNRRVSLLHIITTDLLCKADKKNQSKQVLMEELLATVVMSLSQAEWGVFRFVDIERGRTVGEFTFARKKDTLPSAVIGNKVLVNFQKELASKSESLPYQVFATTDQTATVKCHYIFPRVHALEKNEYVIQNVVDQAQLLYKYLYQ